MPKKGGKLLHSATYLEKLVSRIGKNRNFRLPKRGKIVLMKLVTSKKFAHTKLGTI